MPRPIALFVVAAASWLLAAGPAAAAFVTFTDRDEFLAAIDADVSVETFNNATLNNGLTITTDTTATVAEKISGGKYNDFLSGGEFTQFAFAPPVFAFGATFDFTEGGLGGGLMVVIVENANSTQSFDVPLQLGELFFGVISTNGSFSSVRLSVGTAGESTAQQYTLDDLTYNGVTDPEVPPEVPVVPAPPALALALIGVAGLGLRFRGRAPTQV